jgi:hypothetical protein
MDFRGLHGPRRFSKLRKLFGWWTAAGECGRLRNGCQAFINYLPAASWYSIC